MKRIVCTLLWGLVAGLVLVACGQPTADQATPTAFVRQYQMAEVKTATPAPDLSSPTAARPTATWVPLVTPSATPGESLPSPADVPRIGLDEARARVDAGEAVFVDVRTGASYAQQHIAGAISMPAGEVAQRYAELPAGKLIIFYCS